MLRLAVPEDLEYEVLRGGGPVLEDGEESRRPPWPASAGRAKCVEVGEPLPEPQAVLRRRGHEEVVDHGHGIRVAVDVLCALDGTPVDGKPLPPNDRRC